METELEAMTHQQQMNNTTKEDEHDNKHDHDYNEETKEERTMLSNIRTVANDTDNILRYQQLGRDSKYSKGKPSPTPDTPTIIDNHNNINNHRSTIIHFEDGNDQIIKYWQYESKIRMKLDYGFRSIYEMYRFNYRPIIYAIVSIASIYLPSVIFPKGNIDSKLLFYIHFIFALLNVLIIVYSLGIALAKVVKGDETDNDDRKPSTLPYNPTDDIDDESETDIESDSHYALDQPTILTSSLPNGDPNNGQIVHNDSGWSQISRKSKGGRERKISIMKGLEQNVMIRFLYKFGEQFNVLFCINEIDSRIASKIAPTFSAFIMVFCVLSCHILLAAVTNDYGVGIFELCPEITYGNDASMKSEEIEKGECLARKGAVLNCLSLTALVLLLAFSHYQEISERAQKRKRDIRDKILRDCDSKKRVMRKIEKRIDRSLQRRIFDQLKLKAMAFSICWQTLLCFGILLYHGIEFGYFPYTDNKAAVWISLYGKFNTLINMVVLFNTTQRFLTQYRYILIVMRQFSKPIYCMNIDDIIAWWQYRRYYREYEIKLFANIFHPMVSWLILLTIGFVAYVIIIWIFCPECPLTPDEHALMIIIVYFCFIVLFLCEMAVRTHREQRTRNCGILDREIIHCKRNLNGRIDVSLLHDIRQEIWNNSKPIVLVGLPMTRKTIAIIRGYFIAALGTFIFDWVYKS